METVPPIWTVEVREGLHVTVLVQQDILGLLSLSRCNCHSIVVISVLHLRVLVGKCQGLSIGISLVLFHNIFLTVLLLLIFLFFLPIFCCLFILLTFFIS